MINRSTVFILGAGASIPYNFPSGAKLAQSICEDLDNKQSELYELIWSLCSPMQRMEIKKFRDALYQSGKTSVDKFLEYRPEFIEIGKYAIAGILIKYENPENIFQQKIGERNWYEYLFNHLSTSFDSFGKNKIAFITYNYDRSLEFFLLKTLENSYGKSSEECYEKLKQIPITYLHGKLGFFQYESNTDYRAYEPNLIDHTLHIAAKQIKIIHEDIDDDPQFKEAHRLLEWAQHIHFLGFGYDEVNLKRLKLENLKGRGIFGTTYNLTRSERIFIVSAIKKNYDVFFTLDEKGMDCLDYLRNNIDGFY